MALLDAYERKARLTPGLLAFAPVAFVVVTLGLKKFPSVAIAAGVLTAAGGSYALSILVANFGRKVQAQLWQAWQGPPTTRFLRMRDAAANPIQRDTWRNAIEQATRIKLLTAGQEGNDPIGADNTIEAAVNQIRSLGQDTRFPLVAAENTQYGFERNLYGFRWAGRLVSLACVVTLVLVLTLSKSSSDSFSFAALVSGTIIDSVFLVVWSFIPSASRTKGAAERYAQQLFQAVVKISKEAQAKG